jgi:hypothetical protein
MYTLAPNALYPLPWSCAALRQAVGRHTGGAELVASNGAGVRGCSRGGRGGKGGGCGAESGGDVDSAEAGTTGGRDVGGVEGEPGQRLVEGSQFVTPARERARCEGVEEGAEVVPESPGQELLEDVAPCLLRCHKLLVGDPA